jgi:hypothetical protein
VEDAFITVIDTHTAGDPMRDGVLWTNLTRSEIAAGLAAEGFEVSVTVVDDLLELYHMGQRKPQKIKTMRHDPDRDAQFQQIAALKEEYLEAGLPVISIDVKKRETLGDFARPGTVLSSAPLRAWDHDYMSHSLGVVIPHGIYDVARNEAYLHLGDSFETSEFAADALIDWWQRYGHDRYPCAAELLLLCDGGGSNSSRRLTFKEQLQRVVDRIDCAIRVAHYPPGCSKYNPIEHRVFPHVTRSAKGVLLQSLEMYRDLVRGTATSNGLRVFVRALRGLYEKGKAAIVQSASQLRILFDDHLPLWNYLVLPKPLWEVI